MFLQDFCFYIYFAGLNKHYITEFFTIYTSYTTFIKKGMKRTPNFNILCPKKFKFSQAPCYGKILLCTCSCCAAYSQGPDSKYPMSIAVLLETRTACLKPHVAYLCVCALLLVADRQFIKPCFDSSTPTVTHLPNIKGM